MLSFNYQGFNYQLFAVFSSIKVNCHKQRIWRLTQNIGNIMKRKKKGLKTHISYKTFGELSSEYKLNAPQSIIFCLIYNNNSYFSSQARTSII